MEAHNRYQIADDLAAGIAAGRYAPGELMPSYQQVVHKYGVSPATARRAYQLLRERGLVRGVRGRGIFVEGREPSADAV
ncbi:winged helix-turn-helix domain-containing protein [Actinoplanes sp. NPDC049548]|uniref:winged helix-turn-helix domain-containing protein n=1 Tax=Actinoplanes sp. NPDC049548 TaxID=3155152 RepID=UPI00341850B5